MSWFRRAPPDPKLPPGDLGRSVAGNTFTFHDDAQSLILDNIDRFPGSPVYRAKVIGKDVALVTDYRLAEKVMRTHEPTDDGPRFSQRAAYSDLMAPFFIEPNVLLEDQCEETAYANRDIWNRHVSTLLDSQDWEPINERIKQIIVTYRDKWLQMDAFDVYEECKDMAHELVLYLFLGIDKASADWDSVVELSTTSLRGQFSMPVKANFGSMFRSSYSRGLQAQEELRIVAEDKLQAGQCPFIQSRTPSLLNSAITHTAMFASSLVIKAVASYLTFSLIQLSRTETRQADLDKVLRETERLCPPVIGALRRVMDHPWVLTGDKEYEIPIGWEAWVYFPLANRDAKVYGEDAWEFKPGRWTDSTPPSLTFGYGEKSCLGMGMVRRIAKSVLAVLLGDDDRNHGELELISTLDPSLKDFLGWERHVGGWQGIKQLPVQKPRDKVSMRYRRQ
ncbi:cytochrome P450 [Kockovaella imperatae]|uniref:Cytochrome P450 n=1 Tax=Kockovaella imperatae TaxID=4999 RepID=A0A1Y1UAN0_9TREE|nr:cytochrome P450 [Kockovaella imperatae]ORX35090.1 cytochrome P450 [Kockovaella imperatae]